MQLVTIGEALVVFNPNAHGRLSFVHEFTKSIGGAELNVAIALARLGHKTGWISKLGDDEFGRYVQYALRGEGIDVSQVKTSNTSYTGILFKEYSSDINPNVYYFRKHSAINELQIHDIDENYIKNSSCVHLTGIFPALSENTKQITFKIIEYAKKHNVLISFDPNIRLKLWDKKTAIDTLLQIIPHVDIIFPGLDEAQLLLNLNDPQQIIAKLHQLGCKKVALKLGADGCLISDGKECIQVPGYKVPVVDTVGAGDGFAAGFLSGIFDKKSLHECGKIANAIGAMAVMVPGDNEGYPTTAHLLHFLGETNIVAR